MYRSVGWLQPWGRGLKWFEQLGLSDLENVVLLANCMKVLRPPIEKTDITGNVEASTLVALNTQLRLKGRPQLSPCLVLGSPVRGH